MDTLIIIGLNYLSMLCNTWDKSVAVVLYTRNTIQVAKTATELFFFFVWTLDPPLCLKTE